MKNNLLVSGIINIIVGFFWIIASVPNNITTFIIGAFVLAAGVVGIMYSKLEPEKLYEKRGIVLTFGILLLPFNIISAVMLLVDYDKIKSEYSKYLREQNVQVIEENSNTQVNKEAKKIDILLKVGIAMVTVSGIMIATTSWDMITDFVKMILIALIGILFLGLSVFSDKVLKIRGTTITYWILSMIAFTLSIFMLGNYEILGEWFSVNGEGSSFFVATLITCVSVFSYITYKRFDMESFKYLSWFGLITSAFIFADGISLLDLDIEEVYLMLLGRTIALVLIALICLIFVRNKKSSYIISAIILPIVVLSLAYKVDIAVGLYIGCLALAMIIFGSIKKEYRAILVEGIIILIANIIIQLWEFWGILPVWVYLLVGGLTLIGIVTVKELCRNNENKPVE